MAKKIEIDQNSQGRSEKNILNNILKSKDHKDEHLNFQDRVTWNASTGSLLLDVATGGVTPSMWRLCGSNNCGKAQPVWSKVLTPNGFKPIGEIKIGDFVFGSHGKPIKVIGVFPQGVKDIYRLSFSDSSTTHACGEHLFSINRLNAKKSQPEILDVNQMISEINNIYIPKCDTVYFDENACDITSQKYGLTKVIVSIFKSGERNANIPYEYLFSSVENRKKLLNALLLIFSSEKNSVAIVKSRQLAEDMCFLLGSLGGHGVISEVKDGESTDYKISVITSKNRILTDIVSAGREECVCIKVESNDSLYITDDFILTHNTPSALEIVRNIFKSVPNSKCLWVIAEGRGLSDENMARCGMKFVYDPMEWDEHTIFVLESNVYELFIKVVKDLVLDNPNGVKYAFVVDSVDGLILKDDRDKEITENNKVAGVPSLSKKMLQSLSLGMYKFGHWMGLISQVTSEIKLDQYAKTTNRGGNFSGGNALLHGADYIINYDSSYAGDFIFAESDGKISNPKTKPIGQNVRVTLVKSGIETSKKTTIMYPVKYGRRPSGVWTEREIGDTILMWGMAESKGAWITFSESAVSDMKNAGIKDPPEKVNGLGALYRMLDDRPDVCEFFYDKFRKLMS